MTERLTELTAAINQRAEVVRDLVTGSNYSWAYADISMIERTLEQVHSCINSIKSECETEIEKELAAI